MNISVKNSHTLRNAVLAAAALLFLSFWLMRSSLSPAHLPSLAQIARHDKLEAAPTATAVHIETVPSSTASAASQAQASAPANLAPAGEIAPEQPATQPDSNLSRENRAFFEKAGQAGIQQDKVSRGVLNQLVYPEVREYAYAVLDEQAAINAELLLLASHKQVVVPMPDRIPFRRWNRAEGSIDQHYVNLLLETNTETVALYEKAALSDDPDIAAYARKTLPLLQRRLSAVKALKKITD